LLDVFEFGERGFVRQGFEEEGDDGIEDIMSVNGVDSWDIFFPGGTDRWRSRVAHPVDLALGSS
jgi:hypothetical protein